MSSPAGRLYGFPAAKGGIKNGAEGAVPRQRSDTIYLPRARALNPSGRRQPVPDRTLGAQGQRPGGAINPHARKGVSTFGNTGKYRPGPDPDRAAGAPQQPSRPQGVSICRLPSIFFSKGVHHESGRNYELTYPLRQHHHST